MKCFFTKNENISSCHIFLPYTKFIFTFLESYQDRLANIFLKMHTFYLSVRREPNPWEQTVAMT